MVKIVVHQPKLVKIRIGFKAIRLYSISESLYETSHSVKMVKDQPLFLSDGKLYMNKSNAVP